MPLTERQKQLVSKTFAQIIPGSAKFTAMFYERLWEIAPETKELFVNTNMSKQYTKLIATLATVVNSINGLEKIVPAVSELGKRHRLYGVRKEQFELVGQALLWAMEQELGQDFTPEVKEAWALVYQLIAQIATEAYGETDLQETS